MPPRKEKLSKPQLRDIRREHGIRMKGPLPPGEWPREHKHHFQAVRTIGDLHYDTYENDTAIPSEQRKIYRARVNQLRVRAYDLLDDAGANEPEWRGLEDTIFQIFDQQTVICHYCKNELWKPYMVAGCLHEQSRARLGEKRNIRQMCDCDNKRVIVSSGANDENGPIFSSVKQKLITHAPDDVLDNLSISMSPDKVVGLRSWPGIPHSDVLFPVSGKTSLLLPFLVVEAKSEQGGPGFRAIQNQTAFPIRRLLKAQKDLIGHDPLAEPCLVWFFAYQGEVWRLHMCTHDDKRVRIYDLWQGTIQSHDGALQLLLLVDYIWSWARDIYRPMIRNFFANYIDSPREFSPASTDRFRHSISLSCATSPAPNSQGQDLVQLDQEMIDEDESDSSSDTSDHQWCQSVGEHSLQDEKLDLHLRWLGHHSSPSWTNLGSVRHADIVDFEFRYSRMTVPLHFERKGSDDAGYADIPPASIITMSPRQINELAHIWAPACDPDCPFHVACEPGVLVVRVSFFFHTFCDEKTWQIKRILNCVSWGTDILKLVEEEGALPDLKLSQAQHGVTSSPLDFVATVLDVRQIMGRHSVWCALKGVRLVLQSQGNGHLRWSSLSKGEGSGEVNSTKLLLKRTLAGRVYLNVTIRQELQVGCLWRIDGSIQSRTLSTTTDLDRDSRDGDSMLATRPQNWPTETPQFCLFVLPEKLVDFEDTVHRLLEEAIERRNLYGEPGYQWTKSATRTLWKWRKALSGGEP